MPPRAASSLWPTVWQMNPPGSFCQGITFFGIRPPRRLRGFCLALIVKESAAGLFISALLHQRMRGTFWGGWKGHGSVLFWVFFFFFTSHPMCWPLIAWWNWIRWSGQCLENVWSMPIIPYKAQAQPGDRWLEWSWNARDNGHAAHAGMWLQTSPPPLPFFDQLNVPLLQSADWSLITFRFKSVLWRHDKNVKCLCLTGSTWVRESS